MAKAAIKKSKDPLLDACDAWHNSGKQHVKDMIVLGQRLIEKKAEISGSFVKFVKSDLPICYETARVCMRAYELYADDRLPENYGVGDIFKLVNSKEKLLATGNSTENKGLTSENTESEDNLLDDIEGLEDEEAEESTDDDFEYEQPKVVKKTDAVVVDKPSKDRFGQKVPARLNDIFATDTQYNQWRNQISDVKSEMIEVGGQPGFERIEEKFIKARFENLFELIRIARPYCVCPVCSGDGGVGSVCGYCKGNGWMTKQVFHATPEEFKAGLKNYKAKK